MQQTDYRQMEKKALESAYRVDLTNPTNLAVSVLLIQKIAEKDSLLRENYKSQPKENNEIKWHLKIPARQAIPLRYRIRLTD